MRRIEIQPPDDTKWKRWLSDCQRETQRLTEAVARGETPEFKTSLYRRESMIKAFFFSGLAPFYGKCVYCETAILGFQHGDIEHFRPKGGVTDENDQPIVHSGYYWLAYDWQNLLPACIICNQPSAIDNKKIGKHNRFPVVGAHAQTPADVAQEKALLINPASSAPADDPTQHLAVDIHTGLMVPLTDRGKMCIEIFGLNLRDQLVADRKRVCLAVQALLIQVITSSGNSTAIAQLHEIRQGKHPYTLAARTALSQISDKLLPILDDR